MPRASGSPRTRTVDRVAITAVMPVIALLPAWAIAVGVFWWVTSLFHQISYLTFAGVWLLLCVVLFWKPTQLLFLRRLLGARKPTREERDDLQRAWLVVAQAHHIAPNKFVLAVIDADDLNAFACGGHLVVVSSFAVAELTHQELTGVLAHELRHHIGSHTIALTIGQWLSIPIILLAHIGFFFQNVAQAATESLTPSSSALNLLGRISTGIITIVAWLFIADLRLAQSVGNFVGKGAEFVADAHAVEMGFGRELSSALRKVIEQGGGERPSNWRDRIVSSHPPARTRVARIDAQIRQRTSRSPRQH